MKLGHSFGKIKLWYKFGEWKSIFYHVKQKFFTYCCICLLLKNCCVNHYNISVLKLKVTSKSKLKEQSLKHIYGKWKWVIIIDSRLNNFLAFTGRCKEQNGYQKRSWILFNGFFFFASIFCCGLFSLMKNK